MPITPIDRDLLRETQLSRIGGSVHPFDNRDPLGKALADSIEQGAADAVQGVANWYQRASADQAGYGDDLLRLLAGGVRNTTDAWKAATAEQEGIGDDILRGVGWTVGKGMQVLDAGSYYGGKLGGNIARVVGVDPRIGGALGNVGGDLLAGGVVKKAFQVGKLTNQMKRLQKAGYGLEVEHAFQIGKNKGYALAFGDADTRTRGIIDALTANKKTRQLINNTEAGAELQQLISVHQSILRDVPETLIEGRKVKVWPGSEEDLITSARRMIQLKEQLGIPSAKSYVDELGAFVKDGYLARITGGQKGSPGIGEFQSRKNTVLRRIKEESWPVDEDTARRTIARAAGAPEKHHFRVLESSKPFSQVRNSAGEYVARDPKQLERVAKRLQADDIFVGNQDRNELFQSILAHRGKKDHPLNIYASHNQLKRATDLQGISIDEADFIEVLLKGNDKPTWVKQVRYDEADGLLKNPFLINKAGERIPSNAIAKNGKLRFRIGKSTYDPKQVHGFSQELQKRLANITSDDDLYDAIKFFYEVADEPFKGAATLASDLIDNNIKIDKLTKELKTKFSPETLNWIKALQKMPQFEGDPRLLKVLTRKKRAFESKLALEKKLSTNRKRLSVKR